MATAECIVCRDSKVLFDTRTAGCTHPAQVCIDCLQRVTGNGTPCPICRIPVQSALRVAAAVGGRAGRVGAGRAGGGRAGGGRAGRVGAAAAVGGRGGRGGRDGVSRKRPNVDKDLLLALKRSKQDGAEAKELARALADIAKMERNESNAIEPLARGGQDWHQMSSSSSSSYSVVVTQTFTYHF